MIFLDLHKAYDALDRSRCLEIVEGYGVGTWSRRLLQTYWRRLTMVARAGRYYGTAFQGERWVTQGDLIPPTIFNVVVGNQIALCRPSLPLKGRSVVPARPRHHGEAPPIGL